MQTPFKLEARNITKKYPGTTALDDVSLGFAGGQVHALLGKNGAGKSTLVKIISGATRPSVGQLLIEGRPVQCARPKMLLLRASPPFTKNSAWCPNCRSPRTSCLVACP